MNRRQRRAALIPMMPDTRRRIATAMHLAAEAMLNTPGVAVANEAARQLAIITAAIDYTAGAENMWQSSTGQTIATALQVLENVLARHDAGENWGVTGDEAACLRSAAAQFDHVLRLIPFNVYRAAELFVKEALDRAEGEPTSRRVL